MCLLQNTSVLELHRNRAVVGAQNVGVDVGMDETSYERRGDEYVVNPPPHVAFSRFGPVGPPGVVAVALMKLPKGVHKSSLEIGGKSRALLICEAFVSLILLGTSEVV